MTITIDSNIQSIIIASNSSTAEEHVKITIDSNIQSIIIASNSSAA